MSYTLSRLSRTLQNFFRFGTLRIKDESGVLSVRDGADANSAAIKAANLQIPNGSYKVTVQAPTLIADAAFILPASSGANGQALLSNGAGGHYYANVAVDQNTIKAEQQSFNQSTSSPQSIATLPAGIQITQIDISVTTAASAGSPSLQVGYGAGNTILVDSTDVDLKTAGLYVIPMQEYIANSELFKLYITPNGQTFSGNVIIHYSLPS